jgi:ParB-like chromosome segregation protein Spo0J
MPVLRDEKGGIIAGHGRVLAGQAEGYDSAPCMTARGWSAAKKRAYVITDNKLSLTATWDDELLRGEIADLANDGFDLALTGFDEDEIGQMLGGIGEDPDVDGAPPGSLGGSKFGVIVECEDEQHQQRVYEELTEAGHKARVVTV